MNALTRTLAVAVLALTAAAAAASLAWSKPPWLDEVFEVVGTCRLPWTVLAATGDSEQGSAAPLYYLLQKANLETSGKPGEALLVRYRAVSIAAFALLAAALTATWTRRTSPGSGIVAGVLLLSHPFLLWYAAENRPYMLWAALFAVSVLAAAAAAVEPPGPGMRTQRWRLGLAVVALAAVATPGFLQGLGLLATVAAVRAVLHPSPWRRHVRPWLPAAAVTAAVGLWYAGHGNHVYQSPPPFDLLVSRDPSLVKGVIRLVAPRGQPLTVLALVAIGALAWWAARRLRASVDTSPGDRWVLALTALVLVQAALALPLAAAVVVRHFHFVPRIFIYLAVCHVLLVACGWHWTRGWIARQRGIRAGAAALVAVLATAAVTAVVGYRRDMAEAGALWPEMPAVDCRALSGASAVYYDRGAVELEDAVDGYLALERARRRAGCAPASGGGAVVFTGGPEVYRIVSAPPSDARPLDLGRGEPVRLR